MSKWVHRLSDLDKENKTATCSFCGFVDIYFHKPSGVWKCKNRKREMDRETQKRRYRAPNGRCEICGRVGPLVYDHDHTTGQFRGWLCNNCNAALGMLNDDKKRVVAVLAYLEKERPIGENLSKHSLRVGLAQSLLDSS